MLNWFFFQRLLQLSTDIHTKAIGYYFKKHQLKFISFRIFGLGGYFGDPNMVVLKFLVELTNFCSQINGFNTTMYYSS